MKLRSIALWQRRTPCASAVRLPDTPIMAVAALFSVLAVYGAGILDQVGYHRSGRLSVGGVA